MSLHGYSGAAYNIAHELRDLLQADDFAQMRAQLSLDSVEQLIRFRGAENDLLRRIVSAAPKARQKLLDKLPVENRFWAIAAAAQIAFESSAVLRAADQWLTPGSSYRDMVWYAQEVLTAQYEPEEAAWPFPTRSPFDQDQEEEDEE